jgi:integrase
MTRLTPATARGLAAGQELFDHEVTGLRLRAGATKKSWRLRYENLAGTERVMTLGRFPEMCVSDARKLALGLKLRIKAGEDPAGDRQAQRAILTVSELCDRYLDEYAGRRRGEAAFEQHQQLIEAQIKPGLGSRRVTEVTTADVDVFLEKVFNRDFVRATDHRSNVAPTAHWTAHHTRTLLRQLFKVAMSFFKIQLPVDPATGLPCNPVMGSVVYAHKARKRYGSKAEMARIAVALDQLATARGARRPPDPLSAACIWTLFFTGARVSEIRLAKCDQVIERSDDNWVLHLAKHKTDKHMGARDVQMPLVAMELLQTRGSMAPRDSLFGAMTKRFLQKRWEIVREAAGCPTLQLRDARRTFASFGLSAGYSLEQIGELLGHTNPQTTKGYAYMIDELKAPAANEIANAINAAARPSSAPQ